MVMASSMRPTEEMLPDSKVTLVLRRKPFDKAFGNPMADN